MILQWCVLPPFLFLLNSRSFPSPFWESYDGYHSHSLFFPSCLTLNIHLFVHIFGASTPPLTYWLHYLSLVVPHSLAISNQGMWKHNLHVSENKHSCTSSVVLHAALKIQWNEDGKVLHEIKSALHFSLHCAYGVPSLHCAYGDLTPYLFDLVCSGAEGVSWLLWKAALSSWNCWQGLSCIGGSRWCSDNVGASWGTGKQSSWRLKSER